MRLLVLSVLIAFISSASAGKVVDIWHNHFPFIIRHLKKRSCIGAVENDDE